jgi:hypothetical protein
MFSLAGCTRILKACLSPSATIHSSVSDPFTHSVPQILYHLFLFARLRILGVKQDFKPSPIGVAMNGSIVLDARE